MSITNEDVVKLASLAKLRLSDSDIPEMAEQLTNIIGHMQMLENVNTEGVAEPLPVGLDKMPLRDDRVEAQKGNTDLEKLTHDTREGFILVPRLSTHEDL